MAPTRSTRARSPLISRGVRVLEGLAASAEPLSFSDLLLQTRFPKSSLHMTLRALLEHELVLRANGRYRIGPKLFELGSGFVRSINVVRDFEEVSRVIVDACGETTQLAMLDGTDVLYLAKRDGTQPVRLVSSLGSRLPAYSTALGKALLAGLPPRDLEAFYRRVEFRALTPRTMTSASRLKREIARVRASGYAHDNEETTVGLQCVAAPIRNSRGQVLAAISISVPSGRVNGSRLNELITLVTAVAKELSRRLGYKAGTPQAGAERGALDRNPNPDGRHSGGPRRSGAPFFSCEAAEARRRPLHRISSRMQLP